MDSAPVFNVITIWRMSILVKKIIVSIKKKKKKSLFGKHQDLICMNFIVSPAELFVSLFIKYVLLLVSWS